MPEIIPGNYRDAILFTDPRTIQTAAEIQKDRVEFNARGDTSLNHVGFWTANVPLYGLLKGEPSLLFGGRKAFLQFYVSNIQEVYRQIVATENNIYTLSWADDELARFEGLNSGTLVGFDLKKLFDKKFSDEFSYFSFNPSKAYELYGPKRQFLELIHGLGDDFLRVMEMLSEHGITESRVYGLNPDIVTSFKNVRLVGLSSCLYDFYDDSDFSVDCDGVDSISRLRGVRSVVPAVAGALNLEQTLNQLSNTNPTAQVSASVPEVVTPTRKILRPEENPANPLYEGPSNRFKMLEMDETTPTQPTEEPVVLSKRFQMLELD